jgi:MFS family permease
VFLAVNGIVLLFAARVLQGVAVSAESGALRAALIELQPGRGGSHRRSPAQSPPLA